MLSIVPHFMLHSDSMEKLDNFSMLKIFNELCKLARNFSNQYSSSLKFKARTGYQGLTSHGVVIVLVIWH